ncbi:hypothetical protein [Larsenimonas rhizosphaerae]|uniref:DUF3311 domain-containing protein n=1 Tax=Larsenimonas rhizosphaerae TaxID=2944682 RepID=A0AA41ZMK2_9GAMM|nr:hypothetical protein [Larsenimonas rhizosphaerae]MCX2524981.1 hypothetical protein [Larsenimonas rhizosphaerae]
MRELPEGVRPLTRRGWWFLALFIGVIGLGLWPVMGWVNRPIIVLGLPAVGAWAYLVVALSTLVMVAGNRWLVGDDDD